MTSSRAPSPLAAGDFEPFLARLTAGDDYKTVLEALLLAVPPERGSRFDLLLRESRGSWIPLTHARRGRALFLGNPLSGTVLALARAGFDPCALDDSPARLAWARQRHAALAETTGTFLLADSRRRLPFADGAFTLVVHEGSLPDRALQAECARCASDEAVFTVDNRLGYKQSSGHRGDFRIPSPLQFAQRALFATGGKRTLWGYLRGLRSSAFDVVRAFALYPHANDFSFVVGLRSGRESAAPRPRLYIGPKERENRAKVLGYRAGLFPALTPSFALFASRSGSSAAASAGRGARHPPTTRIQRALEHIAAKLEEPPPELDIWVSSRGNSAVVHTERPGHDPEDPSGRWTLHLPFSPSQAKRVRRNITRLRWLRDERPQVPHPAPYFLDTIDGQLVACQQRLPGLTAAQLSGRVQPWKRLYADIVERLADHVVEPGVRMDDSVFAELIEAKFELVLRYTEPASTRRALERMLVEARERLLGQRFPRVLYHADLRSKHVQVRPDGSFISLLDWGSSEASDLPYFDLICLLIHENQHRGKLSGAAAWHLVRDRTHLDAFERGVLAQYAERLELTPDFCRALDAIFPVLVGGMSEKNWDFSRPRWMQRLYGV